MMTSGRGAIHLPFLVIFFLVFTVTYVTSCFPRNYLSLKQPLKNNETLEITTDMKGNADKNADNIIRMLNAYLKGKEPYELQNVSQCSPCYLSGLHTMKRAGHFTVNEVEDLKRVQGNFGFSNVSGECKCAIGFMVYAHGDILFQLHNFSFYIDVQLDYTNDDVIAELTEIKVIHKGKLYAVFKSKGLVGWVFAKFTRLFHLAFLAKIRELLYLKVRDILYKHKEYLGNF